MDKMKPFSYEIDPDYDFVLEERNNTYTSLRKIKWGDSSSYRVDIRRYYATADGERMSKGCSFMTEEGVNEATKILVQTGYGRDSEIFNAIKDSRPELYSMFIEDITKQDKKFLDKHVESFPPKEDEVIQDDEYYNLDEVI